MAKRALQAAQSRHDLGGEAMAHRAIAIRLSESGHDTQNNDEADQSPTSGTALKKDGAWWETAAAWQRAGDGPGRMEALCALGQYRAAQALGRLETKRPLAASRVLNFYGALLLSGDRHAHGSFPESTTEAFADAKAKMSNAYPLTIEFGGGSDDEEKDAKRESEKAATLGLALLREAAAILNVRAPESHEMSAVAHNLGLGLSALGNLPEAEQYLNRALSIAGRLPAPGDEARPAILLSLAHLAEAKADARRAQAPRAGAATPRSARPAPPGGAARTYRPKALLVSKHGTGTPAAGSLSAVDLRVYGVPEVMLSMSKELTEYEFTSVAGGPHIIAPASERNSLLTGYPQEMLAALSPEQRKKMEQAMQQQTEMSAQLMEQMKGQIGPDVEKQLKRMAEEMAEDLDPNPKRKGRQRAGGEQQSPPAAGANGVAELNLPVEARQQIEKLRQEMARKERDGTAQRERDEARRRRDSETLQASQSPLGADYTSDYLRFTRHGSFSRTVGGLVAQSKTEEAFKLVEDEREHVMRDHMVERALFLGAEGAKLSDEDRRVLSSMYTYVQESTEQKIMDLYERVFGVTQRFEAALEDRGVPRTVLAQAVEEHLKTDRELEKAAEEMVSMFIGRYELFGKIVQMRKSPLPVFVSLEVARRSLAADEVYVSFSVGAQQTYVFVTRPSGQPLAWTVAVPRQSLYDQVIRFRDEVSGNADLEGVARRGRALYTLLFPPAVRERLQGARRVRLSPEGFLWNLPFAALVVNDSGPPHFLGIEKTLTYVQSLSLSQGAPATNETPVAAGKRAVVVVGISEFTGGGVRRPTRDQAALKLDPLPNAKAEAVAVARLYGVVPLLDGDATEAAVRRRIEGAGIIHIATHGYAQSDAAMSSALIFTVPPGGGGLADNGLLQAWEILSQVRLRADLVVLSACETARGEGGYGDGLGRLIRTLQAAGAGAVVASQWQVADDSTKLLMEDFHRNLRGGMTKDEALREAMKAVQATPGMAHPSYWAPFLLTGSPAALKGVGN
jgi:CHAT domain-containing protein/tetratricopeptide (TPR) repeat protein